MSEDVFRPMASWSGDATKEELLSYIALSRALVVHIVDQQSIEQFKFLRYSGIQFQYVEVISIDSLSQPLPLGDVDIFILIVTNIHISQIFIKKYFNQIGRIPKILIAPEITPLDRASALRAGFDGAFDIYKDPDVLFISNLIAIKRRYDISDSQMLEAIRFSEYLNKISYIGQLNIRQEKILRAFISSPDGDVEALSLRSLLSLGNTPISENQLKVLITQTRKKLRPGLAIINSMRLGKGPGKYCLVNCDVGWL